MAEVPAVPDDIMDMGLLIERPVFIVGCARSGTSILGEAVAAHPRVAYLFEASEMWNVLVPAGADHRLTRDQATPEIAGRLQRALGEATHGLSGDVLVEKNPKHVIRIPFLDASFSGARFLHVIRDGRDTVASLMFRNRGERWGHLETPGWRALLERYPRENHIRCAHQWKDSVTIARSDASSIGPGRYREVRYEALLRNPAAVMAEVLEFLELPPDPRVDAFLPRIQDVTEGSYHAKKQVRHYVENHTRRIGRHEENLTPAQRLEVEAVCGALLRELGYV